MRTSRRAPGSPRSTGMKGSPFPCRTGTLRDIGSSRCPITSRTRAKRSPAFLGIEFPTELADESFSVYDHPKVLIFRNTGHLAAAEMEARVVNGRPSRPLDRVDLLLASSRRTSRPGSAEPAANAAPASPPSSVQTAAKPAGQGKAPGGAPPGAARETEKPRSAPPDSVVG